MMARLGETSLEVLDMTKFGWSYPAGAADDPNAPYNQDAEPPDNSIIKEAFARDYGSPFELYRATYKYTDCGPSVGVQIEYEDAGEDGMGPYAALKTKWLYCDDLRELGTWADIDAQGLPILAISVSSIVEGVEQCVDPVVIEIDRENDTGETLAERYSKAVKEVDEAADEIWKQTHGCDDCGPENFDEYAGYRAINPDCPTCEGKGVVI